MRKTTTIKKRDIKLSITNDHSVCYWLSGIVLGVILRWVNFVNQMWSDYWGQNWTLTLNVEDYTYFLPIILMKYTRILISLNVLDMQYYDYSHTSNMTQGCFRFDIESELFKNHVQNPCSCSLFMFIQWICAGEFSLSLLNISTLLKAMDD